MFSYVRLKQHHLAFNATGAVCASCSVVLVFGPSFCVCGPTFLEARFLARRSPRTSDGTCSPTSADCRLQKHGLRTFASSETRVDPNTGTTVQPSAADVTTALVCVIETLFKDESVTLQSHSLTLLGRRTVDVLQMTLAGTLPRLVR